MKVVVVHYNEIALKGKNRAFFEKALVSNIQKMLGDLAGSVKRIYGRILVFYDNQNEGEIRERLKKVFGIYDFSFAFVAKADIEEIKNCVRQGFEQFKGAESFRITASRSEKYYPFTSLDIEREIGAVIHTELGIPVDLHNPEKTLFIEVAENQAYLYDEKIPGPGGLPSGVSGKVVVLLSNGFDSPVAAWRMMRRGCEPIFVHFHSYPHTSRDAMESVEKLVGVLSEWSPAPLKLFLIPFVDVQQEIVKNAPSELRIIMYRRWMLKIAERVAKEQKARALVTGDAVGQVASQTLENIEVISEAARLPILRPLIGHDKQEIIDEARRIGTHDISALPYDDCCNLFVGGSPKTKARIGDVKNIEDPIRKELEKLSGLALDKKEEKVISFI